MTPEERELVRELLDEHVFHEDRCARLMAWRREEMVCDCRVAEIRAALGFEPKGPPPPHPGEDD